MADNERYETEYFTVEEVKVETQDSLLCLLDTGDEVWIPKSQLKDDSEVSSKGDTGEIAIPRWLAEDRDLI
jgi:hypothetical protein